MTLTIQVGTILMKEWPGMPQLIGFETEPGLGEWSMEFQTCLSWIRISTRTALA